MRIRSSLTRARDWDDSQTMTPMIDIVFLLLVFFVCVASDQVVEMSLPTELTAGTVATEQATPRDSWITEVKLGITQPAGAPSAVIEMNGRTFNDYDQFRSTLLELADLSRESPVILDVAQNVHLGDVIRIYDACRGAKFTSIHFAMKQSELNQ